MNRRIATVAFAFVAFGCSNNAEAPKLDGPNAVPPIQCPDVTFEGTTADRKSSNTFVFGNADCASASFLVSRVGLERDTYVAPFVEQGYACDLSQGSVGVAQTWKCRRGGGRASFDITALIPK